MKKYLSKFLAVLMLLGVFAPKIALAVPENQSGSGEISPINLMADILINGDTEHDKLYSVKKGQILDYTGRLGVKSIKDKINEIADKYTALGVDISAVGLKDVNSVFNVTFTAEEGLEIPENPQVTLTENNLFKIESIIKTDNSVRIKMILKKEYTKFSDLQSDVNSVDDNLEVELKAVKVKESNPDNAKLKVVGLVDGNFKGVGILNTIEKPFEFSWIAIQDPNGKDFELANSPSDNTIQFTVIVKPSQLGDLNPINSGIGIVTNKLLNINDHSAYLYGYPNKTFRQENSMTRAEVAEMFSRLMIKKPQYRKVYNMPFTDVSKTQWFYDGVGHAYENKILKGYPDGSFKPNQAITRAEFAAMAAQFDNLSEASAKRFIDVKESHWAFKYINSSVLKGWIKGYPDGSFKAEQSITRAEVVTITNRMLNRKADPIFIEENKSKIINFIDLNKNYWAYLDIVEATNGHDYNRKSNGIDEIWLELNGKEFHVEIKR